MASDSDQPWCLQCERFERCYDRGVVSSDAASVEAYLGSVADNRREVVGAIRDTVNAHLPGGYAEGMLWGMIGWYVPLSRYPAGYHAQPGQPLPLAALAAQKQYVSLYLMGTYCGCAEPEAGLAADSEWFRSACSPPGRSSTWAPHACGSTRSMTSPSTLWERRSGDFRSTSTFNATSRCGRHRNARLIGFDRTHRASAGCPLVAISPMAMSISSALRRGP
jgi:hypothetical protein